MAVYTRKVEAYIRALELEGFDKCSSKGRSITVRCSRCTVTCREATAKHESGCPNDPQTILIPIPSLGI